MVDFSLNEAFILSIWVELLLYGCLVPLFWASVYIMHEKIVAGRPNWPMLGAAAVMFVLATAHVAVNLRRLLDGYVWSSSAVDFFNDLDSPTHVVKDTLYTTQSLLGDAFAESQQIYRCWLIWERRISVVIVPVVLLVCSTFSGYIVAWLFVKNKDDNTIFDGDLYGWIVSFYTLALVQNLITTTLIAYAIWRSDRTITAFRAAGRSLMPIVGIVMESAALYVAAQIALLVLYVLDCNAQYIALEMITPTVGLVFTSIVVRIGLRSHPLEGQQQASDPHSLHLRPISVKVSTESITHVELDGVTPTSATFDSEQRLVREREKWDEAVEENMERGMVRPFDVIL
ncbi:hypothetical protein CALCODRAFT_351062 [Calocera cornea HHB12733]|uniref:Uncharacterized protein n=1 Tax=Calocera cornea HHB12733 TaxID=1353952 RepID=A0A165EU41_9BASI|nr:hypothetical protein CALCODRAFT_351062 [Calocera cornea HHB12733]